MSRHFDFSMQTRIQARFRQWGHCAVCGDDLAELWEAAHHVVPNQCGEPDKSEHSWLSSEENCVVLCDVCHDRVHEGVRYRDGAVAPASYFPYSHGDDQIQHRLWMMELESRASLTIWDAAE